MRNNQISLALALLVAFSVPVYGPAPTSPQCEVWGQTGHCMPLITRLRVLHVGV